MKRVFLLLFFLIYMQESQAQKEAAVWYFGNHAGLDFNTGAPKVLEDGALNTVEGCATIADATGNLLFYSDGITVWNRNHRPMPNGENLEGHSSSTQSAIIIPAPNQPNIYYIFTVNYQTRGGLHYSRIDMSLHGGLGDVTEKNILLDETTTEKITAVKHENGTDFWVLAHDWGNDAYLAYEVTGAGVSQDPVLSKTGFDLNYASSGDDVFKSRGYLKASVDGSQLAVCHSFVGAELLNFNALTGRVSNPRVLMESSTSDFYGVEFSPSGDVVYVSIINDDIYQFDLKATSIATSIVPLEISKKLAGGLQLALDGKIYVASLKNLSRIENPEELGLGCDFKPNFIDLGSGHSNFGLPTFATSYLISGITAANFCLGDNTQFTINEVEPITHIDWDFGDGTTSQLENPAHVYANSGEYIVSATIQVGTLIKTRTKTITIYESPQANAATYAYCYGDEMDHIDLSILDVVVLGAQDTSVFNVSYYRSYADALLEVNKIEDKQITNDQRNKTLFARVENNGSKNCFAIAELTIMVNTSIESPLEEAYRVCPDLTSLSLDGGNFDSWIWRNELGEILATSRNYMIDSLGTYSLTIAKEENGISCERSVFFDVIPINIPEDFTTRVNNFSEDMAITIDVTGVGNFQYSIDGKTYQDSNRFEVSPGKYKVYVRNDEACGIMEKEVIVLGYSKFFTPNNDGANDFWKITGGEHYRNASVSIFDRYGKLLKQLRSDDIGWDGIFQGTPMPSSDYWFCFNYEDGSTFKGHFALKR